MNPPCHSPAPLLICTHNRWLLFERLLHVLIFRLPPDLFRWSTVACFSVITLFRVCISLYLLLPINPSAITRIIKITAPKISPIFKRLNFFSTCLFCARLSAVCMLSFICFKRLNLDCSKAWYCSKCSQPRCTFLKASPSALALVNPWESFGNTHPKGVILKKITLP